MKNALTNQIHNIFYYLNNRDKHINKNHPDYLFAMPEDLIVVGGGLAGIAASLALADEVTNDGEKCFNVTLIESGSKLGGRVSSIVDSKTGYRLDYCQHSCFRIYHRFLQLMARSKAFDAIKLQEKTRILFIDPKTGETTFDFSNLESFEEAAKAYEKKKHDEEVARLEK